MKANETRGVKAAKEIFHHASKTLGSPVGPIKVLYLVRRYVDGLGPGDWGVDATYTLILATLDKKHAERAKEQAETAIKAEAELKEKALQERLEQFRANWIRFCAKDYDQEELEADCREFLERNAVSLPYQKIEIVEVLLEKDYNLNDEPFLGGGAYVE